MRVLTGISLDPIILKKIDYDRGLIPRSRYIEKILRESQEKSNV